MHIVDNRKKVELDICEASMSFHDTLLERTSLRGHELVSVLRAHTYYLEKQFKSLGVSKSIDSEFFTKELCEHEIRNLFASMFAEEMMKSHPIEVTHEPNNVTVMKSYCTFFMTPFWALRRRPLVIPVPEKMQVWPPPERER